MSSLAQAIRPSRFPHLGSTAIVLLLAVFFLTISAQASEAAYPSNTKAAKIAKPAAKKPAVSAKRSTKRVVEQIAKNGQRPCRYTRPGKPIPPRAGFIRQFDCRTGWRLVYADYRKNFAVAKTTGALKGKPKTQYPLLIIPKMKLNTPIGGNADNRTLARGPGHVTGTSKPGELGNVGISGHRTLFTRPFKRLAVLRPGDLVILGIPGAQVRYRVVWTKVVKPQAVWVLAGTKKPSVTLTTCTPEGSAKYRLVVRAELAESL